MEKQSTQDRRQQKKRKTLRHRQQSLGLGCYLTRELGVGYSERKRERSQWHESIIRFQITSIPSSQPKPNEAIPRERKTETAHSYLSHPPTKLAMTIDLIRKF
ncbi:Hypothetical predicted protein [Prunus dulcis]|uniref:Uncharacterized protein n=1 Tax=Prunus dulcis TaxID=3755 RepID=A0A5E4E6N4_PRUDU|nr:Hypothetical predicted protein [Prunus dulcis]